MAQMTASGTTVGQGDFVYRVEENWAKAPEGQVLGLSVAAAHDSQGRIYILQRKDPPVLIFDREGNFLSSWGNGSFVYPHGLAIVDDIVYLVDDHCHVCLMYTLDGKPIQMLGRHGVHSDTGFTKVKVPVERAAGPFNRPTKLVPGPNGDLFVSDGYGNARVHVFSPEGRLKYSWGEPGSFPATKEGRGKFNVVHALMVLDGKVYVCDRENSRIQVFTIEGEHLDTWVTPFPQDIVLGPDGLLYVSGRIRDIWTDTAGLVTVLDPQGNELVKFETRGSHDLCVDAHGDIYVLMARKHPALRDPEFLAKDPNFRPDNTYGAPGVRGAVDKYVRVR